MAIIAISSIHSTESPPFLSLDINSDLQQIDKTSRARSLVLGSKVIWGENELISFSWSVWCHSQSDNEVVELTIKN